MKKIALISLFPYLLTSLFLTFVGCQKNIDVNVPVAPTEVVIEGYVENGKHPYVMVTRSAPFVGFLDSSELAKYVVTDAVVTVSNGTVTDTLRLGINVTLPVPLAYISNSMIGEEGRNYTLKVIADGQVLTATTRLQHVVKLDSVWFKVDGTRDTLGYVWAHLTDPDTLGNYYRWFAKRIGKDADFIAPFGSVFDDKFINGKSFDFAYNRGQKPNSTAVDDNNDESGFFKIGERIAVKFCSINQVDFNFWRSEESQVSSNGNPFAAPAPIQGNINGGLGIWGSYAAYYDTIIAR